MTYPHMFRTEHTETITTSSIYGSFYKLQEVPHVTIHEDMIPMLHHVDDVNDEFIENLREFVAVPNISGSFENRHDMTKAINLVEKWLTKLKIKYERFETGWFEMSQACCKKPTVLLGRTLGHPVRNITLLVYAHLDISKPNMDEWKTNPFEVVEQDKALYGKGTAYGKGSLLCWFHAIQTYRKLKKPLPVRIKFIIESMHEQNHDGLEELLNSKKSGFLSDIDYVVVNEAEWLGTTMPCLSYGAVGVCRFELTAEKNNDSDPKEDINAIMNEIADKDGNIVIPNFHKHVTQITPEEEHIYDYIDYDFESIRKTLPPHQQTWDKNYLLMKFWRLPSIIYGDMVECQCDEPKPDIYKQYFAIKIVPIQIPEHVGNTVVRHVFDVCSGMHCQSKIDCEMVSGSKPWIEEFTTWSYHAARKATIQVYKKDPNLTREDREVAIILLLNRVLDKNILLLPISNGDSNSNQANENISRKNYFEGTKLLIAYLWQLAS